MTCEVALGPLWDTLAAPSNQSVLGKTSVAVLYFDVGELYAAVRELIYKVEQLALCSCQHGFQSRNWCE